MAQHKASIWWGPPKKFTSIIENRKISWLELFYDLVYVIAISKITHLFSAHPGLSALPMYIYLFSMIFWGWLNGSMYHDLHGSPGIRTRLMTLWQMMAVAALIVCLSSSTETITFRSTIALMVLQVFISYLWWSVGIYDKAHRVYSRYYTGCFLFATSLLFISLFTEGETTSMLFWVALIFNFLPAFLVITVLKQKNEDFSLSPNMVERLGLFTIIVFGECVLGVINSITKLEHLDTGVWLNFGLGILVVFALWWIFFSLIADRESQGGFLNANFIQLGYIPTLGSLGIIGASFPGLFLDFETGIQSGAKFFFGSAMCIFLLGMLLLTYLLEYPREFHHAKGRMRQLLAVLSMVILAITFLAESISLTFYLVALFSCLLVIIVMMTRIWFTVQLKLIEKTQAATNQ